MPADAPRAWRTPADRRDARRAEILAAAAQLFSSRGYRATTMDDIAEQFGVTKPALYRYVGGKEQILAHLVRDAFDELDAVRRDALSAEDPRERVRRFVAGHVAVAARDTKVLFVLEIEADELDAETAAFARTRGRAYRDALAETIERGRDQGIFRAGLDVSVAAYGILGMCSWVSTWYRAGGRRSARDVSDELVAMALAGLT